MIVYALFNDRTAKDVRIIVNKNNKEILEIGEIGVLKDSVFVAARNAIQQSWPLLLKKRLLEENNQYLLATPLGFGREVEGKSTGLSFALAFICKLSEEEYLNSPLKMPGNLAATGIIDDAGDVKPVMHIQEKAVAAIEYGCSCLFLPRENATELLEESGMVESMRTAGMQLILVDSVQDFLEQIIVMYKVDDKPSTCYGPTKKTATKEALSQQKSRKLKLTYIWVPVLVILLCASIYLAIEFKPGNGREYISQQTAIIEEKATAVFVKTTPYNYPTKPEEISTPNPSTSVESASEPVPAFIPTEIKKGEAPKSVKPTLQKNTNTSDSFPIALLNDSDSWKIDPADVSARLIDVNEPVTGKALQIDYSLEKGESFRANAKAGDFFSKLGPYKNLRFNYFFSPGSDDLSTNNTQISLFIVLRNGSERNLEMGGAGSVTVNRWNMMSVKDLSVNEITDIRLFIGDISFVHRDINKGKLLIRDFTAY